MNILDIKIFPFLWKLEKIEKLSQHLKSDFSFVAFLKLIFKNYLDRF
jgi:hypothetical protein